jgi:8-oxo-dGTP diphosphatase
MMNAFEAGTRKMIPAVLIYVKSSDDRVLMIHRLGGEGGQGKVGDYHAGKWNGLGGKLDPDESAWQAASRELEEEAGLKISEDQFHVLGTLHFPNFKAHKSEDWLAYVMTVRIPKTAAEIQLGECPEGALHWVASQELLSLNLWAGDRHFIPHVLEDKPFNGMIRYRGQEVIEVKGIPHLSA